MNLLKSYWLGYRDEMIATGVVFCVAATGSFLVLANSGLLPKMGTSGEVSSQEQVLGESDSGGGNEQAGVGTPTPSASSAPTASPAPKATPPTTVVATPSATPTTVFVSGGKVFEEEKFRLTLNSLRMDINAQAQTRAFRLDAVLANKTVTEGLHNRLAVAIVRNGQVIIENAPLSLSEFKTVMPGQQLTFTASVSLIEGTDVKTVFYKPGIGGLNDLEFVVIP